MCQRNSICACLDGDLIMCVDMFSGVGLMPSEVP